MSQVFRAIAQPSSEIVGRTDLQVRNDPVQPEQEEMEEERFEQLSTRGPDQPQINRDDNSIAMLSAPSILRAVRKSTKPSPALDRTTFECVKCLLRRPKRPPVYRVDDDNRDRYVSLWSMPDLKNGSLCRFCYKDYLEWKKTCPEPEAKSKSKPRKSATAISSSSPSAPPPFPLNSQQRQSSTFSSQPSVDLPLQSLQLDTAGKPDQQKKKPHALSEEEEEVQEEMHEDPKENAKKRKRRQGEDEEVAHTSRMDSVIDCADSSKFYEIDQILDRRVHQNKIVEFLVSWKGYGPDENSWMAISTLNKEAFLKAIEFEKCRAQTRSSSSVLSI